MRGRAAKHLRRIAEKETVGFPAVSYAKRQVMRKTTEHRFTVDMAGPVRLAHDCTRRVYKGLKLLYKRSKVWQAHLQHTPS